jgi:hypothetical protein
LLFYRIVIEFIKFMVKITDISVSSDKATKSLGTSTTAQHGRPAVGQKTGEGSNKARDSTALRSERNIERNSGAAAAAAGLWEGVKAP